MKKKTELPETVDEIWKECLRTWAWVDKHREENDDIDDLKERWVHDNYEYEAYRRLKHNCFFCYKAKFCDVWAGKSGKNKSDCLGAKIDPEFRCVDTSYDYTKEPHEFYLKLLSLNRKRLKAKK
jgi:hypothetical protein